MGKDFAAAFEPHSGNASSWQLHVSRDPRAAAHNGDRESACGRMHRRIKDQFLLSLSFHLQLYIAFEWFCRVPPLQLLISRLLALTHCGAFLGVASAPRIYSWIESSRTGNAQSEDSERFLSLAQRGCLNGAASRARPARDADQSREGSHAAGPCPMFDACRRCVALCRITRRRASSASAHSLISSSDRKQPRQVRSSPRQQSLTQGD